MNDRLATTLERVRSSAGRALGPHPRLTIALGLLLLVVSTAAAAALETWIGIADASPVYLLAVVIVAIQSGTTAAVLVSVASFLAYDFFFIDPRFTFAVADPIDWLNLLLFLVVAVVIGRLAALQATRAGEAASRARTTLAMFGISRSLARSPGVAEAAVEIVESLRVEAGMDRVWIGLGETPTLERVIADTGGTRAPGEMAISWVLHRRPGDQPPAWVRTHSVVQAGAERDRSLRASAFRVPVEADGRLLGSIWGLRAGSGLLPDGEDTRTLSMAADQVALALRREQLATEATSAEIARRSDALKSALVDSVSHDLRTPLATIRAIAGGLMDEEVTTAPEDVREAAGKIDDQAARLSELVRGLLDLSRIEAGELRADIEVHELGELVAGLVYREEKALAGRELTLDVPADLPPVLVDALFFEQAVGNVVENAATYAGPSARIQIAAAADRTAGVVDLTIEDDGPGIAEPDLGRVFDKFYRGSRRSGGGSRGGVGIGLTIARGLVQAMGGDVSANRGMLGGLAVRIRLPAVRDRENPAVHDGDIPAARPLPTDPIDAEPEPTEAEQPEEPIRVSPPAAGAIR